MNRLPIETPPRPRSPWQLFYGAVHRLRRRWYTGRAERLPRPVLSIGNLHFGGSGKTPMVAAVATYLRDRGHQTAILSRGYGSHGEGVRVVSLGEGPLLGPGLAGDEPVLLAGMLPGVSVVVGPDRHRAGKQALGRLDPPPDLFLLDDGFSHLRLHRDLDILTFPASDPFAGGRLMPSGRLREPLAAATHAHAAVLTGYDGEGDTGRELARALRPHGFGGPGFSAATRAEEPRLVTPGNLAPGSRVLVVSGIARPQRFLNTVRDLGFEVGGHLSFGDHHRYDRATLDKIEAAFADCAAAAVLTTGKDRVKLQGHLELPLAEIPIRSIPEPGFFEWLEERLQELLPKAGS